MDQETTAAKMAAQLARLRASAMTRAFAWKVESEGLTARVGLPRNAEPNRIYVLRIQFDEYDRRAPIYTFVNPQTYAWSTECVPPNVEHSPGKICTPGTREFHEDLHKNDAQHAWDPVKYPVIDTVRMIHRMMNQ